MIEDIVAVDWSQVRFRRAFSGLAAVLVAIALIGLLGNVAGTTAIAVLFVIMSAGDGTFQDRWPGMARYTVFGAVLGGLAYASIEAAAGAAVVMGVATYLGTLAAALGPVSTRRGLFLTLWAFLALSLGSTDTEPWSATMAFLVGGVIAIGITWLRLRFPSEDAAEERDVPDPGDEVAGARLSKVDQLAEAARSPIGLFAVLRTVAVMLAVVLGYAWFESHALWAALTVIIVVKPSTGQTTSLAIQRTLGTAVGAGIAIAVAQVLPSGDAGVFIAFMLSAYFMVAFMNANYTLFATFLTATLVFAQRLAEADAFEAGTERLGATLVGAGISIGVMAITIVWQDREEASPPSA